MHIFQPFLERKGVVILDGGLATELERRGADLRDPLWSAKMLLDDPELICAVHRDYLAAGADVITAASYQASFEGFARRGLDHHQAANLMRQSVALACAARDEFASTYPDRLRPLVAASVGCYGAVLHDGSEYRGDYGLSVQQLMDWHRPRLEVLAESGADLLACETIPCLAEAEALALLLRENHDMPAWLSFSCRDEKRVWHGETLTECVAVARDMDNVVAVGVNCTAPKLVEGLLASIADEIEPVNDVASAKRKLGVAYPNSGEAWDAATHAWTSRPATCDWPTLARRWHARGARLIGGCCRTTPATIASIAQVF